MRHPMSGNSEIFSDSSTFLETKFHNVLTFWLHSPPYQKKKKKKVGSIILNIEQIQAMENVKKNKKKKKTKIVYTTILK